MTQELIAKLYASVKDGSAKVLTQSEAIELKGQRIATIFFGYKGQDGYHEFTVGDIREISWIPGYEPRCKELLCADGTIAHRLHFMLGNDFFSGSDSDREVYYIPLDNESVNN